MKHIPRAQLCPIIKIIFFLSFIPGVYAGSISLNLERLLNHPDKFDNSLVKVEGEVIGEPLKARKGVWINISFKKYNLGVFLPSGKYLDKITHWGKYGVRGDYLLIQGVFHKNCPQHYETDIHLKSLSVIKTGIIKKTLPSKLKIRYTILLLIISLTFILIYFLKDYLSNRQTESEVGI